MKKKVIIIISIFIAIFFIAGCFNYRDLNKAVFITASVVDIDDEGNIVLYEEAFKAYRGATQESEKGQRILFKGKGKTVFEAERDVNLAASYKVNYTQDRAFIFTERAAQKGLDLFIDFFDRDQELLCRANMYIFIGSPEKLLKLNLKEDEYVGTYLQRLIQNTGTSSRAVSVTANDFYVTRTLLQKTEVLTVLKIKEDSLEDKLMIDGGAVIKNDKLQGLIRMQESQGYNFLMDYVRKGTLEVTNPDNKDKYITLEIVNSHTNTKIVYKKDNIELKKYIMVRASIGDVQGTFQVTDASVKKITKNSESNIKKYTTQLFNDYKNKELDIFNVQQLLFEHYPKVTLQDAIKNTYLDVEVKVELEGSSTKYSDKR